MTELVRIATAGSVDDGKSTLIGRLLYDSKALFTDQYAALEAAGRDSGDGRPNLAMVTDGLRAEREQGITIDVAYRYFATPRRKFIIADTPGHVQYTRNMVTGASTADLALILIDASTGVVEQARRHAFLASLLAIPHFVVCVNKMDLVDFSQQRFAEIRAEFERVAAKLDVPDLTFVPMSALHGDNVVDRGGSMPWYEGTSLLHHLEEVHVASDRNLIDTRFPVQYVVRPQQVTGEERGYAGTLTGGVLRSGDEVVVLPSGLGTTVREIFGPGGEPLAEAFAPQAVSLRLADQVDVSRGDMICRPGNRPHVGHEFDAMVCWLTDESVLSPHSRYTLHHTTRATKAVVRDLTYRLDVNTLHRDTAADSLALNDIGRVRLRTQQPLMFDPYRRNRETGSFILIDDATNNTIAAGMITDAVRRQSSVVWHDTSLGRAERGSRGMTVWLTGLSGSGKSSVGAELERLLVASGRPAYLLDGDNLRHGLNADLGFGADDRSENVRRVGAVSQLFADAGVVSVAALISPYRRDRDRVRQAHDSAGIPFVEVFVDTPLPVCESRDPKGLYAKARDGGIRGFTGVDDPYEPPESADVVLRPGDGDPQEQAAGLLEHVLAILDRRGCGSE
ncbi:adenylyl-sulfate kinase [Saccharopolyspora sp. NPDC003752]